MHRPDRALTVAILAGSLVGCDLALTDPTAQHLGTIVAGAFHTCWLTEAGEALCWGDNSSGQLGIGASEQTGLPALVSGGLTFRTLSTGGLHTCGITTKSITLCWGSNGAGAVGDGTRDLRPVPVRTAGDLAFQRISAGGFHSCALTENGTVYCWGSNGSGQLGVRTVTSTCGPTPCHTTPTLVSGTPVLQSVSAGLAHTCGLTADAAAYCWGANAAGQLGNGFFDSAALPVLVTGELPFVQVSAGGNHTCALTTDGIIYCWGLNDRSQLGTSATTDRCTPADLPCSSRPLQVQTTRRFRLVAAGIDHTCAITYDGTAYCWGKGRLGQLGNGAVFDRTEPQLVLGNLTFVSISAGTSHTCASTTAGEAYCWGENLRLQLGNGGAGIRISQPTPVSPSAGS